MNILVTNDDGYKDCGINTLYECLKEAGHSVYMIAPATNKSAVSHGITLAKTTIKLQEKNKYSLTGTPADCVIAAFASPLLKAKIDLVIAGINDGGNIGTDTIYSGTCAAARQAAIFGIPSIALSVTFTNYTNYIEEIKYRENCTPYKQNKEYSNEEKKSVYERLANHTIANLDYLLQLLEKEHFTHFININAYSYDKWKGFKTCTSLSKRSYFDQVKLNPQDCDGVTYDTTFIGGEPVSSCQEDSDYYACLNGYLSLSLLPAEPVCKTI